MKDFTLDYLLNKYIKNSNQKTERFILESRTTLKTIYLLKTELRNELSMKNFVNTFKTIFSRLFCRPTDIE